MKSDSQEETLHASRLTSIDELLRFAIKNKRLIEFEYQRRLRLAEPHDYGILNGASKLLIYQVRGESMTEGIPDWRMVLVADIRRLRVLKETFPGGRAVPSGKHKKWDQLFIRVASPQASDL
jgi:hypothetical protein